jgi:hypothetical protein
LLGRVSLPDGQRVIGILRSIRRGTCLTKEKGGAANEQPEGSNHRENVT